MKTTGLVLDFYDDKGGEVLKKTFPTADVLPEIVKEAHILTPEEHAVLRDDAYALILVNNGTRLRKFACVDAGNTLLSALYLMETGDQLPAEALKVASENVAAKCEEFGLIEKGAAASNAMGRKRDSKWQPYAGDEADWGQRTNLNQVPGTGTSKVMETVSTLKTKEANVVDVTDLEPDMALVNKTASRTITGEKYALDSYEDVKDAIEYFENNWLSMEYADRHEYAVKTAARAEELGIPVSEIMERYGSKTYAADAEAHLISRKHSVPQELKEVYEQLATKMASVEPEEFVQLLADADLKTGLIWEYGNTVSDPYLSVFGPSTEKLASWSWSDGESSVTQDDLSSLDREKLSTVFSKDLVDGLEQDPVGIFESLPLFQKKIIAEMSKTAGFVTKSNPGALAKAIRRADTIKSFPKSNPGALASRLREADQKFRAGLTANKGHGELARRLKATAPEMPKVADVRELIGFPKREE